MNNFATDSTKSSRFEFGVNWLRFLTVLNDERIAAAENSLKAMLGVERLDGFLFLDAGSGSGLSSLVARRLGARVVSFDYDPQSVACTAELKNRYFPEDPNWTVEEASVLDRNSIEQLGTFDIVYSWGVLHHTGAMWLGLENLISAVKAGGLLFVAIYNDQGWKSHCWWLIKFIYNKLPKLLRPAYAYTLGIVTTLLNVTKYSLRLSPMTAIAPLIARKRSRGMSLTHDLIDWIGGFPYEFATFDAMQDYMGARGFQLERSERAQSLGCHEMVFRSTQDNAASKFRQISRVPLISETTDSAKAAIKPPD